MKPVNTEVDVAHDSRPRIGLKRFLSSIAMMAIITTVCLALNNVKTRTSTSIKKFFARKDKPVPKKPREVIQNISQPIAHNKVDNAMSSGRRIGRVVWDVEVKPLPEIDLELALIARNAIPNIELSINSVRNRTQI